MVQIETNTRKEVKQLVEEFLPYKLDVDVISNIVTRCTKIVTENASHFGLVPIKLYDILVEQHKFLSEELTERTEENKTLIETINKYRAHLREELEQLDTFMETYPSQSEEG